MMKLRLLLALSLLSACAGPSSQRYGAVTRNDVVTSVNGQTGAVTVTVATSAATRAALAAVNAAALAAGTVGHVADFGDGQAQRFTLQLDARTADGKLRIAASGKAGYLWVAGDGVALLRTFVSSSYNLLSTSNPGSTWIPALPGFYGRPLIGDLVVTAFTATGATCLTQGPIIRAGNDGNITNWWGAGQNASINPSSTAINSAAVQAAAGGNCSAAVVPFRAGIAFQAGRLVDLATAVRLDHTTAVLFNGSDVTAMTGKYVVVAALYATDTF
jgi:hypothetical protein